MIYGASDVIRKIVGFLMLPIYTQYLTPTDYGVVQMMMMTIIMVEVLFGMHMGQAVFRYCYMATSIEEKKSVVSTAFLMLLFTSSLSCIILATNSDAAAEMIMGTSQYGELMQVFSILLIAQAIDSYGLVYIRVQQRVVLYFVLSIIKLIVSFSLNIYFLIFLELSVEGVIYSACITTSLMAVFSVAYILYHVGISFSKKLLKELVMFSWPLWVSAIGGVYSEVIGKYFLRLFSGLGDVGLYALAAQFSTLILVLILRPFANIWDSLRYEVYKMPDPISVYQNIFMILFFVLIFSGLGLSLFSATVITLIADNSFWPAGGVVPILVLSSIIFTLAYFNNLGILLKKKTSIIAIGTYLFAITITIGFIILIPKFGLHGVAISLLLGSLVKLVWIERKSKALYDMKLPWPRALMVGGIGVGGYLISLLLPDTLLFSIVGKLLILMCFVSLVFLLPIFNKEEKNKIKFYLNEATGKIKGFFVKKDFRKSVD